MPIQQHQVIGGVGRLLQRQRTAGGVLQAVTAAVQQIEDADRAFDIEAGAIDAMRIAARVAREDLAAD